MKHHQPPRGTDAYRQCQVAMQQFKEGLERLRSDFPPYRPNDTTPMAEDFRHIESAERYHDAGREAYALCLDVDQKPFRDHGRFFFNGTIETDGYDLSIILQDQRTQAEGAIRRFYPPPEEIPYIDEIGEDDFPDPGRTVVCDPGRRDLLYMVHETSEPGFPRQLRYT
ncbi:hypothetical protein DFQ29_003060 [Apophysomyces sp. BC1021]|nr:hypothetical protein DFQ29_003060 [Apophysomyces sp. BC1021]